MSQPSSRPPGSGAFRRICSWCGDEALLLLAPAGRADTRPANFGICPRCLERLIEALPPRAAHGRARRSPRSR